MLIRLPKKWLIGLVPRSTLKSTKEMIWPAVGARTSLMSRQRNGRQRNDWDGLVARTVWHTCQKNNTNITCTSQDFKKWYQYLYFALDTETIIYLQFFFILSQLWEKKLTAFLCPISTWRHSPVAASQTRIVWSIAALARCKSFFERSTSSTASLWPKNVRIHCAVRQFQNLTVPSKEPTESSWNVPIVEITLPKVFSYLTVWRALSI